MTATALLDRLDYVKAVAPGRWVARCPAHPSKSKCSLAISEESDGRVLVHDFGGCSIEDVLGSINCDFDILFPVDPVRGRVGHSKLRGEVADDTAWSSNHVLRACAEDLLLASVLLSDIVDGRAKPTDTIETIFEIAGRLAAAVSLTQRPRRDSNGERRTVVE